MEDVSPLVGILLMVERKRLDLVFQRTTREAGGTRRFGSLMTPRTRSGSAGRSLVVRRRDGGGFPMDHAEDVVHTRRGVIEGHADWLVWLVGVRGSG